MYIIQQVSFPTEMNQILTIHRNSFTFMNLIKLWYCDHEPRRYKHKHVCTIVYFSSDLMKAFIHKESFLKHIKLLDVCLYDLQPSFQFGNILNSVIIDGDNSAHNSPERIWPLSIGLAAWVWLHCCIKNPRSDHVTYQGGHIIGRVNVEISMSSPHPLLTVAESRTRQMAPMYHLGGVYTPLYSGCLWGRPLLPSEPSPPGSLCRHLHHRDTLGWVKVGDSPTWTEPL